MKKPLVVIFIVLAVCFCERSFCQDFGTDMQQANKYYKNGEYVEAAVLFEKWLPTVREDYGDKDTSVYVKLVSWAGICFQEAGQYAHALPLCEETKNICKEVLGNKHPYYAISLNNLALLYKLMGNYNHALPLYEEAIFITKEVLGDKDPGYATSLNNLAILYKSMGNYDQALPLHEEALKIRKEVLGDKHPDYASSLSNLASLFELMGHYDQALPLNEEALKIRKEVLGDKHPDYASSLNNLAGLYYSIGNYEKALPLFEEVMGIRKEVLGNKHPDYATSLNNLALLYKLIGNYDQALPMYEEALKIEKEVFGVNHPNYATSLSNLASLFESMGHYDQALPLNEEALKIRKEVLGINHPDYATSLNNLAALYDDMENFDKALPLYEEAIQIDKISYGKDHPDYVTDLNNLAYLYMKMGNYDQALILYEEANNLLNNLLKDNFSFMLPPEMRNYSVTINYNFEFYNSFILAQLLEHPEHSILVYNNELNLKGMILNSESSIQQSIINSGDINIINSYEELRSLKQQIIFWQQKPINDQIIDLDSLEQKAQKIERELTRESQEFAMMQQQFSITWRDVQKWLQSDEAAIEFLSFDYYSGKEWTDSTLYCALVLKPEDTIPKFVYLCEEKQLKQALSKTSTGEDGINLAYRGEEGRGVTMEVVSDSTYTSGNLYNLIWKPLDSLLQGVKTIYFAPSGLLHSVSMAAISCPDTTLLMDRYNLVQLSSTRTLALPQKDLKIEDAVIYGGIKYDTDTIKLISEARKYPGEENNRTGYIGLSGRGDRDGFQYLDGAQREAEQISDELGKSGIDTTVFSGTKAVEESFRALSGHNAPSIIHLSTHGFYFPDTITNEKNREQMMFSAKGEERFRLSDDPLQRSGLIMAGGNIAWKGQPLPAGLEDGILTAKEVSNMNLLNTQLVVLSACQTGLGDVKGSEGVEGLLRGFKMAGVRYLVLSLWEVPDYETAEFMELFYSNWLGGIETREAFRATQKQMRDKYKTEPYKWAAFVLVE